MERENRGRKNLSAWEQGCMYRKALDEGLYPSLRKLAESVKVDVSLVSKSVSLARLPEAVVAAFPSPLDIQFRWAQPLAEALQKDRMGFCSAPSASRREEGRLRPSRCSTGFASRKRARAHAIAWRCLPTGCSGRKAGRDRAVGCKGQVTVKLEPGAITPERYQQLLGWLDGFVKA
jgi:ParB family chromosome partitioning protein